jgi:hypothetical protein
MVYIHSTGMKKKLVEAAYAHNKKHSQRVGKCIKGHDSDFRRGIVCALEGDFPECIRLVGPFLHIEGGHIPSLRPLRDCRQQKTPFLNTLSDIIRGKVNTIWYSTPPQCCFTACEGGKPGRNQFYPYTPQDMGLDVIITTRRPQFKLVVERVSIRIDNIFFWNGLLDCISAEKSRDNSGHSVHTQISGLGYNKTDSAWKEQHLHRMEKVCKQFQDNQGGAYHRLLDHFYYRMGAIVDKTIVSPYISNLLARHDGDKAESAKDWEMDTFNALHDLGLELETNDGPPHTKSSVLLRAHIKELFRDSNPAMQSMIDSQK